MPQEISGNNRHPLQATGMGVLQHGKLKINIFSIQWSDHNNILIYRNYEDFKRLNRELRKKFPLESGLLRKSDNMIPKLRDVPIFRKDRNTNRFIDRLRLLEDYCKKLLLADQKISHCDVVTTFFTPNSNDLNPNFPNSWMIIPSEPSEKKEQPPRLPKPLATEPIVSQMYQCIEDHETKDTKNLLFKVKCNEHLGVLIKQNSGWWLVENEEKRVAWFPAPFLKPLEKEFEADSDDSDEGMRYYSTMAHEALSCDEVSIPRGVLIEVMEKSNNGWWLIRYNGKTGFVPAMFLKPYQNCHQFQITNNPTEKFSSTSNLYKASSQVELRRQLEDWRPEHNTGKTGILERRKSRSISGLTSSPTYGFQLHWCESAPENKILKDFQYNLEKEQSPRSHRRDAVKKTSVSSENTPKPLPRRILCDKQLDSPCAHFEQPISHVPKSPLIPQRPKPHEILHKCTTITRKALEIKESSPILS